MVIISDQECSAFITLLLPFVSQALYSKSEGMVMSARIAIKHLAHIKPALVFPQIIESFYSGLETLTAVHDI